MENKINIVKEYTGIYENLAKAGNRDAPIFLTKLRREAIEQFIDLGFPDKKNERYKYTDLKTLFQKGFEPALTPIDTGFNVGHVFKCDVPTLNTHLFFLMNGFYYAQAGSLQGLPEGVLAGSLKQAMKDHPELIEKHYNKYVNRINEGLVPLNTALSQDGMFIFVPKNTLCHKPVQIVNLVYSEKEILVQHRNLIIIEENSKVDLVVCDHVVSPYPSLTNSVTEICAGPNSQVDYSRLQNEHNDSAAVSNMFIHQEHDSRVQSNIITLHCGLVRNNHSVCLGGSGAENVANGLFLADGDQHIDNFILIEHTHPHCRSNQLYKGVLDESASGAFTGKIHVHKDAQKTGAYQRNNNIILTDQAKMHTKPQLEIYADDVKCSHGATVGQLNEEALFYLRTRGIPENEARLMLMFGFAHEVIRNLTVEPLRERIDDW